MTNCRQTSNKANMATLCERDERIDSVKYWLIVLVIAGHIFLRPEFTSIACIVTWKWIYLFHMPLFIFISGYFSRKKDKEDIWLSIWKLLEPLIVFQTLAIIFKLIQEGSVSLHYILTPWYALWYLLSLILWRLILQILPDNFLENTKLILLLTFFISIIIGFLPFNELLSIQRTLSLMPFFFLGYCMKGRNIILPKKYRPLSLIFLFTITLILIFFHNHLGSLMHSTPYKTIYGALNRITVFFLAIPMSLAFINICPINTWTAHQGELTMQYYIYHTLAITPLMIIADKLAIPMSFFSAIFFVFIITIGIQIMSHLPNFRKFTNPSSFLVYRKKENEDSH